MARDAGLKTTVHTGEDGTWKEMSHVLDVLELDRLNHGIKCYQSPELMEKVKQKNLTLCLCPSSNLSVGFIKDIEHLREVIRTLYDNGVKFCVNTDNPIMLRTNLTKEIAILTDNNILTEEEIDQTTKWAFEASFINLRNPNENLYL
jgi:adenosine deaminase